MRMDGAIRHRKALAYRATPAVLLVILGVLLRPPWRSWSENESTQPSRRVADPSESPKRANVRLTVIVALENQGRRVALVPDKRLGALELEVTGEWREAAGFFEAAKYATGLQVRELREVAFLGVDTAELAALWQRTREQQGCEIKRAVKGSRSLLSALGHVPFSEQEILSCRPLAFASLQNVQKDFIRGHAEVPEPYSWDKAVVVFDPGPVVFTRIHVPMRFPAGVEPFPYPYNWFTYGQ